MDDFYIKDLSPAEMADYGVCGYKDVKKHKELRNKIQWYQDLYPKGLRFKIVVTEEGGYQGMIEYIPGKYAHRPVNAEGYMFIHCIFTAFRKEFKKKGFGSSLIEACIAEAKEQNMSGVAVVTRKGSFMANSHLFLKMGFTQVDKLAPDFSLLVFKLDPAAKDPSFKSGIFEKLENYQEGLTIIRSVQCPYTEKNVHAMLETAQSKYKLKTHLIDIKDAKQAQETPCAFGTFCLIYEGEILSHHPISHTRFESIISKRLK